MWFSPPLPDLFASSLDAITPEAGREGPRLWVRRMVIWEKRGAVIRDIALRPGLNIVWSPDAEEGGAGSPMGHGGGKTSFCRLLRYCLGEDSFGTAEQRQLIANAMPDAHVGAEVMLDGERWVVVRPIGNARGRHFVQKDGVLDTAFCEDMPDTRVSPLRQAIADAVMPQATPHIPAGSSADEAWEAALAWVSRDQECRLLDILEWRAAETQSRSPSRNMSKAERLSVVRLLINALQPAEIGAVRLMGEQERLAKEAARKKERIEWVRDDVARGLSTTFGGDPTDTAMPDFWAQNAAEVVRAEQGKVDPEAEQKLKEAREAVTEKDQEIRVAENRFAMIDGELTGVAGELKTLSEAIPRFEIHLHDAANPKCQTCGEPLKARAHEFIAQQRAVYDEFAADKVKAEGRQRSLESEQEGLKYQIAAAKQELSKRQTSLAALELKAKETADRVASANGYVTMTTRYRSYEAEIARLDKDILRHTEAGSRAKLDAQECRRASQNVVARLSDLFDIIIRYLVLNGASGDVTLAEDGIHPHVTLHGNLTTAAVDSLKVVAFDLAALALTIEGKTQLPGFWLHDSPREADLGLPLYHRLFELALELEKCTETPLFQYVITTTTRPPDTLQILPWKVLELSSAPREMRLFKMDL